MANLIKILRLEIMTLECHAWLKLRRYADLGKEVERWSFCFINDSTARHPQWVPWSLQILAAESLQYTESESGRCIDSLYDIRGLVDHDKRYVLAVDAALSNAFLRKQNWRLALESLDQSTPYTPRCTSSSSYVPLFVEHDDAYGWSPHQTILTSLSCDA